MRDGMRKMRHRVPRNGAQRMRETLSRLCGHLRLVPTSLRPRLGLLRGDLQNLRESLRSLRCRMRQAQHGMLQQMCGSLQKVCSRLRLSQKENLGQFCARFYFSLKKII